MNREERNGYEVMRDERDIARDEVARLTAEMRTIINDHLVGPGRCTPECGPRIVAKLTAALSAEAGDTDG